MSASSLSVRQEQYSTKHRAPGNVGQNFMELRELEESKTFRELREFADTKRRNVKQAFLRVCGTQRSSRCHEQLGLWYGIEGPYEMDLLLDFHAKLLIGFATKKTCAVDSLGSE
jgi:hypothetical protein